MAAPNSPSGARVTVAPMSRPVRCLNIRMKKVRSHLPPLDIPLIAISLEQCTCLRRETHFQSCCQIRDWPNKRQTDVHRSYKIIIYIWLLKNITLWPQRKNCVLALFSLDPALCQSRPNSPPPLILTTHKIAPYACKNARRTGLKYGLVDIPNPP